MAIPAPSFNEMEAAAPSAEPAAAEAAALVVLQTIGKQSVSALSSLEAAAESSFVGVAVSLTPS